MELTQKEEMAFSGMRFQMEVVASVIAASEAIKLCKRHNVRYIDEPNKVYRLLSRFNLKGYLDTNVKLRDIANFAILKITDQGMEIGSCSKCRTEEFRNLEV